MADDAQEVVAAPPKVYAVTAVASQDDMTKRIAVQETVTAICFWAKEGGTLCAHALAQYEQLSDDPEFAQTIGFLHVNVAEAQDVAKAMRVAALPTFQFYYNAELIEEFSGNNAEKVKLMAKNAVARRVEIIKEAEIRAAEAAAEAAAAEAAAAEAAAAEAAE